MAPGSRYLLIRTNDRGIRLVFLNLVNQEPWWKQALRWIHVDPNRWEPEHRDETIVFDTESNRDALRLYGWNIAEALLSADGRTLITAHDVDDDRVLRCWAVGGWKPLRWPIGVPAGVGLLLFATAKARRRRRPITPSTPPPDRPPAS
jgi:hypothetical protein